MNTTPLRRFVAPKAIVIAVLAVLPYLTSFAQPFLSVTSSTDGAGNFTYTFGQANPNYVWGVFTNEAIVMPFYGTLNVVAPAGWSCFIEDDKWIHLHPDVQQPIYIGETPFSFTVQSSSSVAVLYDGAPLDTYGQGVLIGSVFSEPDHTSLAGGYEAFPD